MAMRWRKNPRSPASSSADQRSVSGEVVYMCTDAVSHTLTGKLKYKDLLGLVAEQIHAIGNQSLGLVAAAAVAIGAVMALQFASGLQRFGGTLYVPELVGYSLFRELGPVLTGLLLAGRVGSGITAELASMNVTEQIDAVRALGESPQATLVLPRILACLLAFPVLTLFGDALSLISAMFVSFTQLSIGPTYFFSKILDALTWDDVWTGLLKSDAFALYISMAACWKGLNTTGGTRGVGESTTWIVVRSSIFILVCDFFMSKIFILTVFNHD